MGQSTITAALAQLKEGEKTLETTREETLSKTNLNNILTMEMVANILTAQNFSMPAGYVEQDGISYMVSVGDEIPADGAHVAQLVREHHAVHATKGVVRCEYVTLLFWQGCGVVYFVAHLEVVECVAQKLDCREILARCPYLIQLTLVD